MDIQTIGEPRPIGLRQRWRPLLAAAAVVLLAIAGAVTVLLMGPDRGGGGTAAPGAGSSEPSAQPTATQPPASAATQPPGGSQSSSQPSAPGTTGQRAGASDGYQWLWPFAGPADAAAFERSYREGHQPWRGDAGLTAQAFTRDHLGYVNVNRIVRTDIVGRQAWVAVGYANPNGQLATAAVIHLVRVGSGPAGPWEVVGTRDSTLTLTTPSYGSSVKSPVTVGGRITGVDENLTVQVRALGQRQAVGLVRGIPAGGQTAPWSARVPFSARAGAVLTIAVSTGGHVAEVEEFAITGVVAGSASGGAEGDIDGDGRADSVSLSSRGVLAVSYASGRSDLVPFETSAPTPRVLGIVDADRDGRSEVFALTDSGASTDFASVFRYVDGHLRVVTLGGNQARLAYGGTVTHFDSWACRTNDAALMTWSGQSANGTTYTGTVRSYRFDGRALALVASRPLTVTPTRPPPSGCGTIDLG